MDVERAAYFLPRDRHVAATMRFKARLQGVEQGVWALRLRRHGVFPEEERLADSALSAARSQPNGMVYIVFHHRNALSKGIGRGGMWHAGERVRAADPHAHASVCFRIASGALFDDVLRHRRRGVRRS